MTNDSTPPAGPDADPRPNGHGTLTFPTFPRDLLARPHQQQQRLMVETALFGDALEAVAIGRYRLLNRLGQGGMGSVYAAFDDQLDRKIAVKLIHPSRLGSAEVRERTVREARALARLSHPNVVHVYEVGEIEEQLFVAMEFLAGPTLRAWLDDGKPRSWQEVVTVLRQAGDGLAAAHAQGIIHRDFKPHNAMFGADDRVRVLDFGLARLDGTELVRVPDAGAEPTELAQDPITLSGAVLGTPAYMAPEQLDGQRADARSDQFSFCVVLYEALYGERPFGGRTLAELFYAIRLATPKDAPPGTSVPAWLRRVVLRGLARDPEQRFESMPVLLQALADDPATRRRRWWTTAGVVGLLGAAGTGLVASRYVDVMHRCEGGVEQLAGIWDDARRQEVKAAILGTELSYAEDTWVRVEQRLDEYADAWAGKHTEVCEATSVRQEQSTEVMDLRMECLRGRQVALRETVKVLVQADPTRVENAVDLMAELPGLSRCDDVAALRAELPSPEDPQVAAQVEALRERLAQVQALLDAGAYGEGLKAAEVVVERAEVFEYPPLLAEALLERGNARMDLGQYTDAEQDLERAYLLAVEHGHDEVEARAVDELTHLVGSLQARHELGLQWGKTGLALAKSPRAEPRFEALAVYRVGVVLLEQSRLDEALNHFQRVLVISKESLDPFFSVVAGAHDQIGVTLERQGKAEEALTHHQRALAIREEAMGPHHPIIAGSLNNIGIVLLRQGKLDEALGYFQRALDIWEQALGPHHAALAFPLGNIGIVLREKGKAEEALTHHQRALAIWELAVGPHHPSVGATLNNIGVALIDRGKLDEALTDFRRALEIQEKTLGPRHPDTADALGNIGMILMSQGKLDEALTYLQRDLAVREEALGPRHPDTARALNNLGLLLLDQGELDEAQAHFQRALNIAEEVLGPRDSLATHSLVGLAEVALAKHDPDTAREHAGRAVSIREVSETSSDRLAEARFVLARALWPDREQRARARALAEQARDAYAEMGEATQEDLAEVQAWLADHEARDAELSKLGAPPLVSRPISRP